MVRLFKKIAVTILLIVIYVAYQTWSPFNTDKFVRLIDYQRDVIRDEIRNFTYLDSNNKLQNFTIETNYTPIRCILISSWRSGSTFFGDILNAMPGNFYYAEPLHKFGVIKIREASLAKDSINYLKNLLECDDENMKDLYEHFLNNFRLLKACDRFKELCSDKKSLGSLCKQFPLQSMGVLRLRMSVASEFLEDLSLNARIILLIRDPRGVLQSRKHHTWCTGMPDCDDPTTVCSHMVSDYETAVKLYEMFPNRFKVIRYEDLSLHPYEITADILKFYGLPFHGNVKKFLDSVTKKCSKFNYNCRESKVDPFHWTRDLNFSEVNYIQKGCVKAMSLWGYKQATGEEFYPLLESPFP